ncbi:hypothetical protein HOE22_11365 [Candidatus Woesearchaeota archaeon]|jgi:hypothetical protein|nr:hypothetical protein [Candidatus Woesearchaeota archaeon]MBT7558467.1 hypothetical protein [Candidatus Woesearchaeota archaeon]
MSKIVDILTAEQQQEINDLLEVIQTEADIVKQDYEDNPSDMTEEDIVVVHQDSTLLDNVDEKLADIGYNIIPKKK